MDKRGVELSLNVVIVSILAVLVLISLVVFFTFGFGNISNKIKGIYQKSTGGMDRTLAIQLCSQYCELAKGLDKEQIDKSTYANTKFDIDDDGDGNIDSYNQHCLQLGVKCDNLLDFDTVSNMKVIE